MDKNTTLVCKDAHDGHQSSDYRYEQIEEDDIFWLLRRIGMHDWRSKNWEFLDGFKFENIINHLWIANYKEAKRDR